MIDPRLEARALDLPNLLDASHLDTWAAVWPNVPPVVREVWATLLAWARDRDAELNHANRTLFLAGCRGAGKTTILETVCAVAQKQSMPQVHLTESLHFYSVNEGLPVLAQLVERLHDLDERLSGRELSAEDDRLWVELLGSLIDRFGTGPVRPRSTDAQIARVNLADQLMSARALEARFEKYVGRMVTRHRRGADPLFVVVVDDGDLAPGPIHDLLKGLRILWHPRVVWLVTGHLDLLRETMARRVRLELGEEPGAVLSPLMEQLHQRIEQRIFPPHQIIPIRVPGAADPPDGILANLWRALDDVPIVPAFSLGALLRLYDTEALDALLPADQRSRIDWAALCQERDGESPLLRLTRVVAWWMEQARLPVDQGLRPTGPETWSGTWSVFLERPDWDIDPSWAQYLEEFKVSEGWLAVFPRRSRIRVGTVTGVDAYRLRFLLDLEDLLNQRLVVHHPLVPKAWREVGAVSFPWPIPLRRVGDEDVPLVRCAAVVDFALDRLRRTVRRPGEGVPGVHVAGRDLMRAWRDAFAGTEDPFPPPYRPRDFGGEPDPGVRDACVASLEPASRAPEFGGVPGAEPLVERPWWSGGWKPTRRDLFLELGLSPSGDDLDARSSPLGSRAEIEAVLELTWSWDDGVKISGSRVRIVPDKLQLWRGPRPFEPRPRWAMGLPIPRTITARQVEALGAAWSELPSRKELTATHGWVELVAVTMIPSTDWKTPAEAVELLRRELATSDPEFLVEVGLGEGTH